MTARDPSPRAAPRAPALRVPALAPTVWAGALAALAACNGPRVIHEQPVLVTGQRVPTPDGARLGADAGAERAAADAARDSVGLAALASCAGPTCSAVSRGELALGMTEAEVMAATRTAPSAWAVRRAPGAGVAAMTPAAPAAPPADAAGEVALVQLAEGRVRAISYREPQGLRVVERPEDQTPDGRARATAAALVREGDQYAAAGDRDAALERYDRALVLAPADAMLQYRVATLLDLQLRPYEALIRYQRFLQTLELQRIAATGDAYAKLADAIARAQQRVVVLERQSR